MTEFEKQNQTEYTEIPNAENLTADAAGNPIPVQEETILVQEDIIPVQEETIPQPPDMNANRWPSQNPNTNAAQNYAPWNNGTYPNEPQNTNQWNNGPYQNGPQNNTQWNNGPYQNGPQNNTQWNNGPYPNEPYRNPYNPYSQNPKKRNGFATAALFSGIFALLNLCCFNFPSSIILGVGAICIAIISKKGEPMTKTAIAAVVLGVIAIVLGVAEFFYSLWLSDLLKDPDKIAMFNQMFEQMMELAEQTSAAAQ